MDVLAGDPDRFSTLHRLAYVDGEPVGRFDPSGLGFSPAFGLAVELNVQYAYVNSWGIGSLWGWGLFPSWGGLKPDILDFVRLKWAEVKPFSPSGIAKGAAKWSLYYSTFTAAPKSVGLPALEPEDEWSPGFIRVLGQDVYVFNVKGVLFYTDVWQLANELGAIKDFSEASKVYAKYLLKFELNQDKFKQAIGQILGVMAIDIGVGLANAANSAAIGARSGAFF